jgi:hypothetical protein
VKDPNLDREEEGQKSINPKPEQTAAAEATELSGDALASLLKNGEFISKSGASVRVIKALEAQPGDTRGCHPSRVLGRGISSD